MCIHDFRLYWFDFEKEIIILFYNNGKYLSEDINKFLWSDNFIHQSSLTNKLKKQTIENYL